MKRNVRYIRKRCFKGFDESKFKEEIRKLKFFDIYSTSNVDSAVAMLTSKLKTVLDKFAPVKTVQIQSNYAPWLNEEVKKLISQRDAAQLVAAHSQCQDSWRYYRNL